MFNVHLSINDLGPDSFVGKYLQQERVFDPPVDDMYLLDPILESMKTSRHLGNHPSGNRPLVHQADNIFSLQ